VQAPVTEELVFRACVLSVYQLSGASMMSMVFLSPMSFGAGAYQILALWYFTDGKSCVLLHNARIPTLAHLHHAWDIFNRYGRTAAAAKRALMITRASYTYLRVSTKLADKPMRCAVFQFTYTSLFGSYCSYLFIRTGSIFPPIIAHSFCNVMGLPQIGTELKQWPQRKYSAYPSVHVSPGHFLIAFNINSHNCCISHRHSFFYLLSWPMDVFGGKHVLDAVDIGEGSRSR
jgi:prenyl protein peptidase